MKNEEKLRELDATIDNYESILVERVRENGSIACKDQGFEDVCNMVKSLNCAKKHLNDIDDDFSPYTNSKLDPYGEENWDDDEPKSSLTERTVNSDLFGPRVRPQQIEIGEETDTDSYFDVDGIVNNANGRMTTIQRLLFNKVQIIQAKFQCTKIISNGNLISVLQDIAGYTLNPVRQLNKIDTSVPFPMGNIGNMTIYVDAYMRWDDNRILFYVDINAAKENFIHTLHVRDTNGVLI
jgi:hypothetical protein